MGFLYSASTFLALSFARKGFSLGIVVIDFGGQYAHLIANRIRRLNVYAEIRSPLVEVEDLENVDGIILSGGPSSVYDKKAPLFNDELLNVDVPLLGLCYGHQLICKKFGGCVEPGDKSEFGAAYLNVQIQKDVFVGMKKRELVWMSHRDSISSLPAGFEVYGSTDDCPIAAMGDSERDIYGFQFHPEVTHSEHGIEMLDNFISICGVNRNWTMERYVEETSRKISLQVGDRNVFLLVSGGVDSSVAFMLLNQILGEDRVLGLHIDNGFMRKDETAMVERFMKESGFHNLHVVDAGSEFLRVTKGVVDPEEKRRIIGEEFIKVRDRTLDDLKLNPEEWLLGQGTLYTDTIESGGTDNAAVIKTHHNRVGVIEDLIVQGKVVEPLDQLYKDEARSLGETLGLSKQLVWRHPFPGPGLAVRVLCSNGSESNFDSEEVEEKARKIASQSGYRLDILPLKSVGVQGDSRTYAHPALLTGDLDWDKLEALSTSLTNSFNEINRVIYSMKSSKKFNLKLREAYLSKDRLDLLRDADDLVMRALRKHELMGDVTQMPTVLVPLSSDNSSENIVLRPISTDDFMTARFSRLPSAFLDEVCDGLMELDGIEAVLYDVTHKPPGTVEWE